jgi:hypothetical protein
MLKKELKISQRSARKEIFLKNYSKRNIPEELFKKKYS